MQFKLSTLMVVVVAVALGCLGWSLGDWMMHRPGANSGVPLLGMFAVSGVLLLVVSIQGGIQVVIACITGFMLHVLLAYAKWGWPPGIYVFLLPVTGLPLAYFVGSLCFALSANVSIKKRYGYFLPSCIVFGWSLAMLYYER